MNRFGIIFGERSRFSFVGDCFCFMVHCHYYFFICLFICVLLLLSVCVYVFFDHLIVMYWSIACVYNEGVMRCADLS
jgi:hypothetical protein